MKSLRRTAEAAFWPWPPEAADQPYILFIPFDEKDAPMAATKSTATPDDPDTAAAKPAARKAPRKAASARRAAPRKGTRAAAAAASADGDGHTKLLRDSFTIPEGEYEVLSALKRRAVGLERPVKKSELLRAGIKALAALSDKAFLSAMAAVPAIKTGRPKRKRG